MADIAHLLAAAAPTHGGGPDLEAVEARAWVLRRRQQAARTGGALAAVVVVGLAGVGLGNDGRRDTLVPVPDPLASAPSTGPSQARTTPSPESAAGPPGVARPASPLGASVPAPARTAATRLPAGTPTAGPGPGAPVPAPPPPSASAGPSTTGYPEAASCEVTSVGVLPDQEASCRFEATRAGGFAVAYTSSAGVQERERFSVTVTRAGQTTTYPRPTDQDCADGIIEVGDLVVVTLRTRSSAVTSFEVAAGEGFGC